MKARHGGTYQESQNLEDGGERFFKFKASPSRLNNEFKSSLHYKVRLCPKQTK